MDLTLRNAVLDNHPGQRMDIAVHKGRIVEIGRNLNPGEKDLNLDGRLLLPGFVESHIHLDKAMISERCASERGDLSEAIEQVSKAKALFDADDVCQRASRVLAKAVTNGVTRMRTQVEIDPVIGLQGLAGVLRAVESFKWAIDVEICVFPQEGMLNYPGVEALLLEALDSGASLLGGAPYTDSDPHGQIDRLFEIAIERDLDLDLHLDFDLNPASLDLEYVCAKTEECGWQGRVTLGHVSKLSALPAPKLAEAGRKLARAGVGLTVMPATDLFLMGREFGHNVPRGLTPAHKLLELGVVCSLSTNNVLNPFTPFGDCSLLRLANLYANVCQVGTPAGMSDCFKMVSALPAKLLRLRDYGLEVGNPADLVVVDAPDPASAVAELAEPLYGLKGGRPTFTRTPPSLRSGII